MFETIFRNLDDTLRKDAGCSSELDYIEQTSWLLFLKYLDDFESAREESAKLDRQPYHPIINHDYKWKNWAAPKTPDGKIDYNAALTGDDLKQFVDTKLFPYLKNFKSTAEHADTLEYKIGEIFHELKNKIQSGYNLRELIDKLDNLRFQSNAEKHEMSSLYEDKIKNMGNAGRNGGEYYTPRPLIKTIVKLVNPKIGNKIYDGAAGSAGFLCEAYEYLRQSKSVTAGEYEILQRSTFYGKEKKSLAYIIGVMNMILHGIEAPNIIHTNTLAENLTDIQDKHRVDIVLANPPFGGSERPEMQENFPIRTGETAYLFLQHFIKILRAGGRCGMVIKNTFLSNADNASIALRKQLLTECDVFAILELPQGAFTGTGVKTVVLFFEKGSATEKIWYYQLNLLRNLGKTNSLNEADLDEFLTLAKTQADSENSWALRVADIDKSNWDLTANNPHRQDTSDHRTPAQILAEIEALDHQAASALAAIKALCNND
ncbi:MAG: N-6 DNA methylase [Alphaproteobacteria bacterium]|nr:N-6 DNA methylase [Alphaproteobacteria bacterium]